MHVLIWYSQRVRAAVPRLPFLIYRRRGKWRERHSALSKDLLGVPHPSSHSLVCARPRLCNGEVRQETQCQAFPSWPRVGPQLHLLILRSGAGAFSASSCLGQKSDTGFSEDCLSQNKTHSSFLEGSDSYYTKIENKIYTKQTQERGPY